jgi:hypothetical protein
MNAMRFLPVAAAFAWMGVVLSSAQPAEAIAIFGEQVGSYATCSSNTTAISGSMCNYAFNYRQTINIVATSCNSGSCSADRAAYVDSKYSTGRKPATLVATCSNIWIGGGINHIYNLGSCAC